MPIEPVFTVEQTTDSIRLEFELPTQRQLTCEQAYERLAVRDNWLSFNSPPYLLQIDFSVMLDAFSAKMQKSDKACFEVMLTKLNSPSCVGESGTVSSTRLLLPPPRTRSEKQQRFQRRRESDERFASESTKRRQNLKKLAASVRSSARKQHMKLVEAEREHADQIEKQQHNEAVQDVENWIKLDPAGGIDENDPRSELNDNQLEVSVDNYDDEHDEVLKENSPQLAVSSQTQGEPNDTKSVVWASKLYEKVSPRSARRHSPRIGAAAPAQKNLSPPLSQRFNFQEECETENPYAAPTEEEDETKVPVPLASVTTHFSSTARRGAPMRQRTDARIKRALMKLKANEQNEAEEKEVRVEDIGSNPVLLLDSAASILSKLPLWLNSSQASLQAQLLDLRQLPGQIDVLRRNNSVRQAVELPLTAALKWLKPSCDNDAYFDAALTLSVVQVAFPCGDVGCAKSSTTDVALLIDRSSFLEARKSWRDALVTTTNIQNAMKADKDATARASAVIDEVETRKRRVAIQLIRGVAFLQLLDPIAARRAFVECASLLSSLKATAGGEESPEQSESISTFVQRHKRKLSLQLKQLRNGFHRQLLQQASTLMHKEQLHDAGQCYQQALSLLPTMPTARANYGTALLLCAVEQEGRRNISGGPLPVQALENLEKAEAHFHLSLLLLEEASNMAATSSKAEEYPAVRKRLTLQAKLHFRLARAQMLSGSAFRCEKTLRHLEQAIQLRQQIQQLDAKNPSKPGREADDAEVQLLDENGEMLFASVDRVVALRAQTRTAVHVARAMRTRVQKAIVKRDYEKAQKMLNKARRIVHVPKSLDPILEKEEQRVLLRFAAPSMSLSTNLIVVQMRLLSQAIGHWIFESLLCRAMVELDDCGLALARSKYLHAEQLASCALYWLNREIDPGAFENSYLRASSDEKKEITLSPTTRVWRARFLAQCRAATAASLQCNLRLKALMPLDNLPLSQSVSAAYYYAERALDTFTKHTHVLLVAEGENSDSKEIANAKFKDAEVGHDSVCETPEDEDRSEDTGVIAAGLAALRKVIVENGTIAGNCRLVRMTRGMVSIARDALLLQAHAGRTSVN
ncbi:MAG: hypothetical protein MHM6MM_006666 [Cercozoa sp. M6MM]